MLISQEGGTPGGTECGDSIVVTPAKTDSTMRGCWGISAYLSLIQSNAVRRLVHISFANVLVFLVCPHFRLR